MRYGKKPVLSAMPRARRCWLTILALSLLASTPTLSQGSTEPKQQESPPVSTPPERLYTEKEALAAARAAAEAATSTAVPLAVQAAVAEERGKAVTQEILDRTAIEAFRRQVLGWRSAALVAAGAGMGALTMAEDSRCGTLYGAAVGAATALVWWIGERWPSAR